MGAHVRHPAQVDQGLQGQEKGGPEPGTQDNAQDDRGLRAFAPA